MKRAVFLLMMFCILMPSVLAVNGKVNALSVYIEDGEYKGDVAQIYLDIVPGKGRVFMDTYPLSELDLQVSAQKAKNIDE